MYDVFCYGAISLDLSGKLERPLKLYEHATAVDYNLSVGGDSALVAMALAGLGLDVAIAGSPVGDDPMGEYLLKAIGEEGVKTMMPVEGKTAITAIVLDGDRRSTITFHEDTPENKIPIPIDTVRQSRYVYVDGCFAKNSAVIGKVTRDIGIPTILNLDRPAISHMGLFDIVIAGEDVSKVISPEPAEAARKMFEMNKGIAIVTLGEKGCVCCDGNLTAIPAYKIEARDTTGAGAAFAAAFIYSRLKGEKLDRSIAFASAAGAYKALHPGSFIKFTEKDIINLIKRYE
jgi:sugar/nucleoside kinase (ribokinase family)